MPSPYSKEQGHFPRGNHGDRWHSQAILEHGSAYKSVQGRWPGLQGLGFLLLLLWLLLKALPDFVLGRERGQDERFEQPMILLVLETWLTGNHLATWSAWLVPRKHPT